MSEELSRSDLLVAEGALKAAAAQGSQNAAGVASKVRRLLDRPMEILPGSADDWTALDGRANSSPDFLEAVNVVAPMVRNARMGEEPHALARAIVARLAHELGLAPMTNLLDATQLNVRLAKIMVDDPRFVLVVRLGRALDEAALARLRASLADKVSIPVLVCDVGTSVARWSREEIEKVLEQLLEDTTHDAGRELGESGQSTRGEAVAEEDAAPR